jgi:hypothetical protein
VATKTIYPWTAVVHYYGRPRWIWDIPEVVRSFCLQFDYDLYPVPRRGTPAWYINHSCDPNCVIKGPGTVVARCAIKAGDEVTFDYSTNVGWDSYRMKCYCGSAACRGTIRSYIHLDDALRRRYGAFVSSFLLRRP